MKLFRYSGNKKKMLPYYLPVPSEAKVIVEPYLGSGAFSLAQKQPSIGYELNREVCEVWWWLQQVTPSELFDLRNLMEDRKKAAHKPDVRDLSLPIGPQTYVRLNCTSLVTGQLSSWRIYPQHRLPVEETVACLSRIKDIKVICESGENHVSSSGELVFVDPPYFGTIGNYIQDMNRDIDKKIDVLKISQFVKSLTSPVIFSYGSNAPELFPDFSWVKLCTIKCPNMRRGGTIDRVEWVSYINFQEYV